MDETTSDDTASDDTRPDGTAAEMSPEQKRRDQLLAAPGAVESDADPRIEVTEHDGVTRIDIAPDAAVRPGNPYEQPAESGAPGGPSAADDGSALEGPDVETSTADGAQKGDAASSSDGSAKPGGLGQDGTIPSDPDGIAAGHTGEQSTFEPEEDEAAPN